MRFYLRLRVGLLDGGEAEVRGAPQSFHDAMTFGKSCRFELEAQERCINIVVKTQSVVVSSKDW